MSAADDDYEQRLRKVRADLDAMHAEDDARYAAQAAAPVPTAPPDDARMGVLEKRIRIAERALVDAVGPEIQTWELELAQLRAEHAALATSAAGPPLSPHSPAPFMAAMPAAQAIAATDQTAFAIPTIGEPALPFQQAPAKTPPPAAVGPSVQSGETAFVPTIEVPDEPPPVPENLPELSVEQYASLCVDRTMSPGAEAEVAQRYRVLTIEALRALDARWSQRFQAEGELYHHWQQAYAQYEAWVRSQKR